MRLLLIFGPPAVGKMTVGREITRRSPFRLFHNHHTIEPLVEVFGHGTPPFAILNGEFRRRVIEEAARHRVDLIFTFVWQLEDPDDDREVRELVAPYEVVGGQVLVVELSAGLSTRLERNRGEDRIAAKPTKQNVEWSDSNVRELEQYRLNSDPTGAYPAPADAFLREHPHLRLDTTALSAPESAERVLEWLDQQGVPATRRDAEDIADTGSWATTLDATEESRHACGMAIVEHFEIPVDDIERAQTFYTAALGFDYEPWGAEMGMLNQPEGKGINGDLHLRADAPHPTVVFTVDDIEAAVRRVVAAGGSQLGEIQPMSDVMRWVYIRDTEGNTVGLVQHD